MNTQSQLPYLTNLPIRTEPALIEKSNWLTGYKWWTVATAHRNAGTIDLTMGQFKKVVHTEYTFSIYNDKVQITTCETHDNHVSTGGNLRPYDPTKYPAELIPLFDQLIEMTRKGEHFTPAKEKQG